MKRDPEGRWLSADGKKWWDGSAWRPASPGIGPTVTSSTLASPTTARQPQAGPPGSGKRTPLSPRSWKGRWRLGATVVAVALLGTVAVLATTAIAGRQFSRSPRHVGGPSALPQAAAAPTPAATTPTTSPEPTQAATASPDPAPPSIPSQTPASVVPAAVGAVPLLGATWQYQLGDATSTNVSASVYDLDGFTVTAATVASLHSMGRYVICYFEGGDLAPGRPDTAQFPAASIGKAIAGWPGERYLDIRNPTVRGLLAARARVAKSKNCDGVEYDYMDSYQDDTGFPLTGDDEIRFDTYLASAVHAVGMTVGLKNDRDAAQIASLVRVVDWTVQEQCYEYRECSMLLPFVAAGKPVFVVEYNVSLNCTDARANRFSLIHKNVSLGAQPYQTC